MNIINADWELRNLGITTQEVEFDLNDSLDSIEKALLSLEAEYQVVKVPVSEPKLYALLSRHGFFFVEELMRCSFNLRDGEYSGLIKRISNSICFEEMDEVGFQEMNEQIYLGMFNTDRVYLDPFFTKDQAANRYVMWMRDERDRGSIFFKYTYKNRSLGFSCMKETHNNEFYPVLGGIYNDDRNTSLGGAIILKQLDIVKYLGGEKIYTYISSNNPSVVRAYSQLGYVFDNMKYVFVKHSNAS